MKRISLVLRTLGVVAFLSLASLTLLPLPAHAGGVHVSFGFALPVPVVVAPQPVYVAPQPVVIAPPPVYVQPAPVVVYPQVVVPQPQVVYEQPYYGGWGKKSYYRVHQRYWRHHQHDHDDD